MRRGIQNQVKAPLLDDCVSLASRPGIQEQAPDILEPAGRLIDQVLAVAVPEQAARDHHLVALTELSRQARESLQFLIREPAHDQRDFRQAERLAGFGAVEDDIFHSLAT